MQGAVGDPLDAIAGYDLVDGSCLGMLGRLVVGDERLIEQDLS